MSSFYQIPNKAFKDKAISADAKLVLAFLIYNEAMKTKYKDKVSGKKYKRGDYIPIYQINIAQAINKSVDVLRHSYIPQLIEGGYIAKRLVSGVKGTAQNTICEYRILWENIESSKEPPA